MKHAKIFANRASKKKVKRAARAVHRNGEMIPFTRRQAHRAE